MFDLHKLQQNPLIILFDLNHHRPTIKNGLFSFGMKENLPKLFENIPPTKQLIKLLRMLAMFQQQSTMHGHDDLHNLRKQRSYPDMSIFAGHSILISQYVDTIYGLILIMVLYREVELLELGLESLEG